MDIAMAYLVMKTYFNRDLATYAGTFAGREENDIDSDYQDVMYTIFDFYNSSYYTSETPFEICRRKGVKGWVRLADHLLKFWKDLIKWTDKLRVTVDPVIQDEILEKLTAGYDLLESKGIHGDVIFEIMKAVAMNVPDDE
jgi:hypothetical protein